MQPGDEIVVTRLDHDANAAPWVALEERGAVIRYVDIDGLTGYWKRCMKYKDVS